MLHPCFIVCPCDFALCCCLCAPWLGLVLGSYADSWSSLCVCFLLSVSVLSVLVSCVFDRVSVWFLIVRSMCCLFARACAGKFCCLPLLFVIAACYQFDVLLFCVRAAFGQCLFVLVSALCFNAAGVNLIRVLFRFCVILYFDLRVYCCCIFCV